MEFDLDMECSTIMREGSIREIGSTIKCMEKEHWNTQMGELHIKDNGTQINCMA